MFRITSKKRHIYFKVAITNFNEKRIFIVRNRNTLLIFKMRRTIPRDHVECMTIFSYSARTIHDHTW